MWQVVHLRAEAVDEEGWRSSHCACGLRYCGPCRTFYTTKVCPKCKAKDNELFPHGEPLWPERWGCAELMKKKMSNATVWASSYQGEPSLGGGYWFAEYPPHYYETVRPSEFNIYMLCDPSLRKRKKSDRTCIPVIGCGADQNFYLLDLILERMDPEERAEHLFRLHRKWRPIMLGYEEYGLQSDIVELGRRMEQENYRFPVIELGRSGEWHGLSTEARIATMIPQAKMGRWWFPNPETPGRDPRLVQAVRELVDKEWMKYPAVGHDDGLDGCSRINDPAMQVRFPSAQTWEEPASASSAGSWMGV